MDYSSFRFVKMILFLFFTIIISSVSGQSLSRIVNGTDATLGEFPYAVSVRYFDLHQCGGSIISTTWVLTAAHCIFPNFLNVSTILYGTVNLQNGLAPSGYYKNVSTAIVHEDYHTIGGYFNDIALMGVDSPFEFSNTVKAVVLPTQGAEIPRYQNAVLVGWGYSETDGSVMTTLQKVELLVFSDEVCQGYFSVNTSICSHICAGVPGGGKGQCSGDSGGGLTINGVAYGVVSWSDKPCTITPGILTRVPSFIDWIYSKIYPQLP